MYKNFAGRTSLLNFDVQNGFLQLSRSYVEKLLRLKLINYCRGLVSCQQYKSNRRKVTDFTNLL